MKTFVKEEGYTLLEMIITIALIGIALGLSGFGLSAIFNNNVNGYVNEIVNDIRLVQTKEMGTSNLTFETTFGHDGTNYIMTMTEVTALTVHKTTKFPKSIVLEKYDTATSTFKELKLIDDTAAPLLEDKKKTFRFNASSGKLLTSAAGRYRVSSTAATLEREFVVVEANGRVYVEE